MGTDDSRSTLKLSIRRLLLEGPVQVRAEDLEVTLLEWRSVAREVAQELGRPITVYTHTDTAWAALADATPER